MNYSCEYMDIDIYSKYISQSEADALFKKIIDNPIHFKNEAITKKGEPSKKRNKTIYGSIKKYTIVYRGKTIQTHVHDWKQFPELEALSKRIEEKTDQPYNTCVIQIYNTGVVGIKPHRDKEMKAGSIIASISLGETRNMRFERDGCETVDIPLESGTLCLINPPTNDYWLHSIPSDETKNIRVSLIFRNT